MTSKESLESIVAHIKSEVGYINLLVNNAGVIGKSLHNGTPLPAPFVSKPGAENYKSVEDVQAYLWKDTMEDWDEVFRVNTTGAWFASVAFLGLLAEGNRRKVVEQSSQVRKTQNTDHQDYRLLFVLYTNTSGKDCYYHFDRGFL